MPYLTPDSLLAYRRPEPLEEDVALPELGGDVHVRGVAGKAARDAMYDEMSALKAQAAKGRLKVTSASGEVFVPTDVDVTAACWVAACVTEPQLTAFQWLQFAGEGGAFLTLLYERALICSRVIEEKKDGQETLPDGEEAAERAFEDDPLGSAGSPSA